MSILYTKTFYLENKITAIQYATLLLASGYSFEVRPLQAFVMITVPSDIREDAHPLREWLSIHDDWRARR